MEQGHHSLTLLLRCLEIYYNASNKMCLLNNNQSAISHTTEHIHTALYSRSSAWIAWSSERSFANCWLALSWFTTTLFFMLRARFAYFNVFNVSIKSRSDGDIQLIITVRLIHTDNKSAIFKQLVNFHHYQHHYPTYHHHLGVTVIISGW